MINEKFRLIENLFNNAFREEAETINNDFVDVICQVYIHHPGEDNLSVGFTLGLDVYLQKADIDKADSLALEIWLREEDGIIVMTARIYWGYPTGKTVQKVFPKSVEVNDQNIGILKRDLPNLFLKFKDIINSNPNGA